MSRYNYTNPAFCQQDEFYPTPSNPKPNQTVKTKSSPIKIHRSISTRSIPNARQEMERRNMILNGKRPVVPPKPGSKPNGLMRNTKERRTVGHKPTTQQFALVPLEELDFVSKNRYAIAPAADIELIKSKIRYTRSQDDLDRCGGSSGTESPPEAHHSFTEASDQFTSLPPIPMINQEPKLKQAFSSDFGSKSFVLFDQQSMQRYDVVPTDENEEYVDANPELIQMHNGKRHRYAVIPAEDDDEADEETCLNSEIYTSSPTRSPQKYGMLQHNQPKTLSQMNLHKSSFMLSTSRQQINFSPQKQQVYQSRPAHHQSSISIQQGIRTPTKSEIATQRLQEYLSTPRKMQLQHQVTPANSPSRYTSQILASTPKRDECTPQKLYYEPNHMKPDGRSTAVISPRVAASVYDESMSSPRKSYTESFSVRKMKNSSIILALISFMLMLCGLLNSALCLYLTVNVSSILYHCIVKVSVR